MSNYIVVTTINPITDCVIAFDEQKDWRQLLVGDKKSVPIEDTDRREFLNVERQRNLGFEFAGLCPFNHYARKNIGYLYAVRNGAEVIYDTDDDNRPLANWTLPEFTANHLAETDGAVLNIYRLFTEKAVWPRGYPLESLKAEENIEVSESVRRIAVWQGLANGEPDVDAVYRLVTGEKIIFNNRQPVAIKEGIYCPFNSQNTFWNKQVFPLLYLPVTVSFRYTDILRGFVAQRLFWEQGLALGFTSATVYQDRNAHNLMSDFVQEIPMYTGFSPLKKILDSVVLSGDLLEDIVRIYIELDKNDIVSTEELPVLRAWVSDFEKYAT